MSSPAAVTSLIVKVAERCNLRCSYCYMYEHADTSFESRPRYMSDDTFDAMLRRADRACEQGGVDGITIVFHGGEPTLIGPRRFDRHARRAREVLGPRLAGLSIQTNGTLIDDEWAAVLAHHEVAVGVSIDGPPEIHDRVRVDHLGRGSWSKIHQGIGHLREHGIEPAILTVIDPGADGRAVYDFFLDQGLRHMDFLLPDVSRDSALLWYGGRGATPVADYLLPVFDEWFATDDASIYIGIFYSLIERLLGGPGRTDAFGNPPMRYLVVESDGSIEALDALRVCKHGIAASGLDVHHHDLLDLAQAAPLVADALSGSIELSQACRQCDLVATCGGGYLPHRYSQGNGFDNPSVWCPDIMRLITHIRDAVQERERMAVG